jgi:TPR repeat protein
MENTFDIMISYSSEDAAIANQLVNTLEERGYSCWIAPRNVNAGEEWMGEIMRAIRECKVFLLILTQNANISRQVIRELTNADNHQKPIICFQPERLTLSDSISFFLSSIHRFEAFNLAFDIAFEKLFQNLQKIVPCMDTVPKSTETIPSTIVNENTKNIIQQAKEAYLKLNFEEAFTLFSKAAKQEEPIANFFLGRMFQFGEFVQKNEAIAKEYYQKCIDKGYNWGYYGLGNLLEEQPYKQLKANDYFTNALHDVTTDANIGDGFSMFILGRMYERGFGVNKNSQYAVKWYQKAAQKDNVDAQKRLGFMYEVGYCVVQDYSESLNWYRKAAEQGDADAQFTLALQYSTGRVATVNHAEAVKWYRKAAEQGHVDAQYHLGLNYENGKGITKNINEAIRWYKLAAKQGNKLAQTYLKHLNQTW